MQTVTLLRHRRVGKPARSSQAADGRGLPRRRVYIDDQFGDRAGRLWAVIGTIAVAAACLLTGCQSQSNQPANVDVKLQLDPQPPRVGKTDVTLTVTDASGAPVSGGRIELEGNMNHAGMKPVFSTLTEKEPGRYVGTLDFTMAGDWFILVTGQLSDGSRVDEKIDVAGVTKS